MGKKKPFVDRSKSSTYHLLHRSQRDVVAILQEGDTAGAGMILYPTSEQNLPDTDRAAMMFAWRQQLAQAGLLVQEDPEQYMKPITGTGTFLEASSAAASATTAARSQVVALEVVEEVDHHRQLDSIPLTAECMDEEIAQVLFGDFDEGDFEELNDNFMWDAAQEPAAEEQFDYDEHIRKLMEQAKLSRTTTSEEPKKSHAWGNQDVAFFSKMTPLHQQRDDDGLWEEQAYAHETTTPGVVPALTPEEERALCEKFAETLAEYDSDEMGDCAQEEIVGQRPLEGDAQVEAALEEFLYDKTDEIFVQGSRHYLSGVKHGGSGFSALVGKQMVHAKELDGHAPDEPTVSVEKLLADASERLALPKTQPPAEEILIDGKSYFSEKERNPWDCESVLSTYSNLDNNPAIIEASRRRKNRKNRSVAPVQEEPVQPIRLSEKTGLPLGVLPTRQMEDFDDTIVSVNKGVARNKKESKEEKKSRKEQVKREREMARIQKRATREVFKEEFQKQSMSVGVDDVAGKSVFRYS